MEKIILSHPTGNANVRGAAKGLFDGGILKGFYTSLATFPGDMLDKLSRINAFSELKRRRFDPSLQSVTHQHPFFELGRIFSKKASLNKLIQHETGIFSVDSVYQSLDQHVAKVLQKSTSNDLTGVYAYEDGAQYTFEQAKKNGIKCLYELPTGYWSAARNIFEIEKERRPEWAATIRALNNSEQKLARKDEELRLADTIYVASSFTAKTLKDYKNNLCNIKVLPYGFPAVYKNRIYEPIVNRPLKILFVGGLSQQKGLASLFEAINKLKKHVQLTVIGNKPNQECAALNKELSHNVWIPSLPNHKILEQMRHHDLFVFPSLFEGFGLVVTEAMSQGTPVITTERTCGYDLINHAENGWLVEAGSTDALFERLELCIKNSNEIAEVGRAAMKLAATRPWSVYGRELVNSILNQN
jgi:glycosyltransferase involved in cell wall biosynthesis